MRHLKTKLGIEIKDIACLAATPCTMIAMRMAGAPTPAIYVTGIAVTVAATVIHAITRRDMR
jgi:uncharacterized membrane protein YecN with MAPEG domain